MVKFSYEIDMRKQEAGIEKAKEGCTAFHIACFSVAKHAVNQQSKHKQRGKHAEQRLCIHKLIHENYIKQAEQICNDMCALYLTYNRTIEFIHPNQTKKPNAYMQPNAAADDDKQQQGKCHHSGKYSRFHTVSPHFTLPPKRRSLF